MSSSLVLIIIITSFSLLFIPPSTTTAISAYDLLNSYNFPIGLLPKGSTGYDFDKSTAKFSVYFNNTCSFPLQDSYQLKYKSTISGRISEGKIEGLSGVSVKVLFVWLNIVEVVRSGEDLELSVGFASAEFPVTNFEACPECGCGFDCENGDGGVGMKKIGSNPFVRFV